MARWGIISQDRHLARSGSRHRRMEAPRLRSWPDCHGYTYSRDTRTWRCVKNLVTFRGWNGETCIHPSWTCGTGAEAVHRLDNLDIDDVMGDTWTAWRAWTTWNARSKAESRQGGDFVCPAARNTRIEQTGKSSRTFSAYSEIIGGPLLGGTALNGGAHWGTLWLPLAQGTGPRRRGALSVRGAPPPSPQKSPASVLARLGRCQWKGNESTYLRRPFFQSSSFQFPSPFSSTPSPSRVCFVREARCRSFALLGVQFNFLPWVVCLLKFCGLCLVQ